MNDLSRIEAQVRDCFGRVVYTHKTHEKMADACSARLNGWKMAQLIASAATATVAVAAGFCDPEWIKIATGVCSVITLLITSYMKGFDPGGVAQKHRDAAASIWTIRESYLSLLTDINAGQITYDQAAIRREALQAQLAAVYKSAPQTNGKAYKKAQDALKLNEEYTLSNDEVDCFLPEAFRKEGQR